MITRDEVETFQAMLTTVEHLARKYNAAKKSLRRLSTVLQARLEAGEPVETEAPRLLVVTCPPRKNIDWAKLYARAVGQETVLHVKETWPAEIETRIVIQ